MIALANVNVVWGSAPALPVKRVLLPAHDRDRRGAGARSRPEQRQGTLVHEMTHTALQPDTSARTPPWLIEGVAMHVSDEDRRLRRRRGRG